MECRMFDPNLKILNLWVKFGGTLDVGEDELNDKDHVRVCLHPVELNKSFN